ncbi:hypothetical protein A3H55_00730 [Candidatus Kuenenbacteria bacterium RIFCSPLOWO2_02_FULL_42_16]|uniref:Protein kinase domain-containing protein n=1 Tax=Candidatus Kuenenbacteria bacterium RIFCSPLOWO2_02_FULL_42_16 TaxID=1798564 RepID=A0A1F6FWV7_9BACT|nr:MAG: hypothetical protein A3H55_00730 [Candidatus Kuenenbacteria bacterium RIFCSPLOWO2_02_FULL_42_16]
MSNTILTHYAKKLELNQKADRFLAGIIKESGFASEKEIWRGLILGDKKKAGSVIYAGRYKNKPAVLKIQHLKPVIDEPEIIRKFYQHSKSRKVFAPKIYFDRPWNRSRGYGYFISELIEGENIKTLKQRTKQENFAGFMKTIKQISKPNRAGGREERQKKIR